MPSWFSANIDYLIFSAGSLVFFTGLSRGLRKDGPERRLHRGVWLGLIAILGAGWLLVRAAADREFQHQRQIFESYAPTYADELERMGHSQLALTPSLTDPLYLKLIEVGERWLIFNPAIRDIYTLRRTPQGTVVFLIDPNNSTIPDTPETHDLAQGHTPGQPYPRSLPEVNRAFAGESVFVSRPYGRGQGQVISAYRPLHGADHTVEAVLGIDYPAKDLFSEVQSSRLRWISMLACLVIILGVSASAVAIAQADLVKRHQAEIALRDSEARLRALIKNLPFDLWVKDRDGRQLLQNQLSFNNWGTPSKQIPGIYVVTPESQAHWESNNRRALAGEVVTGEVAYTTRSGELHYYYNLIAPVYTDDQVTAVLGVNLNITDRVKAEEARRISEKKLALHVRQTPLAVIEWDLDFHVRAWNPAAERIFGFTRDEAMGKHACDLMVPSNLRSKIMEVWKKLLAQKGGSRSQNENVTKDGRTIFCEWYNTPLIDDHGHVIGVAAHAQDITDRANLEAQLRQAHKMESIGQLAGG
ncbi:MAG TPA: PAS domain S-box protein, partial [Opitutaceae bacterium]|nr:PAS domain S-box protein [Opitutaceae bacterium]